jgi:hypothetical protein
MGGRVAEELSKSFYFLSMLFIYEYERFQSMEVRMYLAELARIFSVPPKQQEQW